MSHLIKYSLDRKLLKAVGWNPLHRKWVRMLLLPVKCKLGQKSPPVLAEPALISDSSHKNLASMLNNTFAVAEDLNTMLTVQARLKEAPKFGDIGIEAWVTHQAFGNHLQVRANNCKRGSSDPEFLTPKDRAICP